MKNTKTIAIDWLQLSLRGRINWHGENSICKVTPDLILEDLKRGSTHFVRSATVILCGEVIGKIDFNPRNSDMIGEDTVIFKAENRILYQTDYVKRIKEFAELTKLSFKHMTKLDIAIDSEQKGKGLFKFLDKLSKNQIKIVGQAEHQARRNSNNEMNYFRLGSSSSNKLVRCYYKKQEIEQTQKRYITEFWEYNGLDTTKEIERVEISMKKKEISKYWNPTSFDELLYLESTTFLSSLFQSGTKKFFEFVRVKEYIKKKRQADRCKKISFFDFKGLGGMLLYKIKAKVTTEIYRLKMFAKTSFIIAKATGSKLYAAASLEAAKNLDLMDWYEHSQSKWNYEFRLFKKSGRYKFLTSYIENQTGQLDFVKINAYM